MVKIRNVRGFNVPTGDHKGKTIVLGSDHRGFYNTEKDFYTKHSLISHLQNAGYVVVDVGTNSKERCDYPNYSFKIGEMITSDPNFIVGIGLCGSGIGIGMVAVKFTGVYPALCATPEIAANSRRHNNSNMLTISADGNTFEAIIEIVDA